MRSVLGGVSIAWAVWAGVFAAPVDASRAPADAGSVDAATIDVAEVAPNRLASTQRDPAGSRLVFPVAHVARPAVGAAPVPPATSLDFDRRAERRRVVPRRAPPRLGDDGFD